MKPTRISVAKGHETPRSASVVVRRSEFDNFLFATVGNDRNEMPLSVLSALTRLEIDPWLEAAELAQVPRETAIQRLASSIAALADGPLAHLDPGTIAVRLIGLLPSRDRSNIRSRERLPVLGDVAHFRAGMGMFAVFIVFMSIAQWLVASRQTPAQVDTTHAPVSSRVSPEAPPPNSGQ